MKARAKAIGLDFVDLVFSPLGYEMLKAAHIKLDGQMTSQLTQMIVDKIINVNIHTTIPISPTFLSQIVKVILNYYWYLAGYIN